MLGKQENSVDFESSHPRFEAADFTARAKWGLSALRTRDFFFSFLVPCGGEEREAKSLFEEREVNFFYLFSSFFISSLFISSLSFTSQRNY